MADPEFIILGDALWLDFVNTTGPGGRDLLPDRAAFHRWTKALKLAADPERVTFAEMTRLRQTLAALAAALADGRQPPSSAIRVINDILADTEGHHQLTRVNGAWRMQFRSLRPPLARDAIGASAAQTISDPTAQVRRCANPACPLFFVDRSSSQSRRWCSVSRCGAESRVERRRSARMTPVV